MIRTTVISTALSLLICGAGIAHADNDTGPGYATPAPNGGAPAITRLPHVCSQAMIACGFHWSPDTGTWKPSAFKTGPRKCETHLIPGGKVTNCDIYDDDGSYYSTQTYCDNSGNCQTNLDRPSAP